MPDLKSTLAAVFVIFAANVFIAPVSGQESDMETSPPKTIAEAIANAKVVADIKVAAHTTIDRDAEIGEHPDEQEELLQWVDVEPTGAVHQVQFAEPVTEEYLDADYAPYEPELYTQQSRDPRCCVSTFWVRADYLHWWLEGANVPVLVATSPDGTSRNDAAVLGLPSTAVLFGGDEQGDEDRSGGRIEFGRWFQSRGGLGWHVAYFGVEDSNDRGQFDGSTIPILGRPFFSIEPTNVGPNAELIAFPGELEGNIAVDNRSSFDGAEFMFRWMLANGQCQQLQLVAGYQYNGLDDDLIVQDFKRVIGGSSGLAIGTTLAENDQFQTENQFHGVAVGILASERYCSTTLDVGMQLALGNNNAKVRIDGSTTSSVPVTGGPNDVVTTRGGLLALPTNIGRYENDVFAVVPQLNVDLGYYFHPQLRATLGYRFLYWSQVARAAEHIDTGVNLTQVDPSGLDGEARPRFDFRMTDFWAQGINAGLDYRF